MKSAVQSLITSVLVLLLLMQSFYWFKYNANKTMTEKEDQTSSLGLEELRREVKRISASLDELWCETSDVASTGQFCLQRGNIFTGGNHLWDLRLCQEIEKLVGRSALVDLGAGLGFYGMCFLRRKEPVFLPPDSESHFLAYGRVMGDYANTDQLIKSWDGYDGAKNVEVLTKGLIKEQDLGAQEVWLGHRWDWVLSLEVGEHIPKKFEGNFLRNLVRHGCNGIILSWAVPAQDGHHHVNGQTNTYVKSKMAELGLESDDKAEEEIRRVVELPWFKNTIMVFRYKSRQFCD